MEKKTDSGPQTSERSLDYEEIQGILEAGRNIFRDELLFRMADALNNRGALNTCQLASVLKVDEAVISTKIRQLKNVLSRLGIRLSRGYRMADKTDQKGSITFYLVLTERVRTAPSRPTAVSQTTAVFQPIAASQPAAAAGEVAAAALGVLSSVAPREKTVREKIRSGQDVFQGDAKLIRLVERLAKGPASPRELAAFARIPWRDIFGYLDRLEKILPKIGLRLNKRNEVREGKVRPVREIVSAGD